MERDVAQTTLALTGYGVGLGGFGGDQGVGARSMPARASEHPRIAAVVLPVTQLLNTMLVPWLQHAGLALSIGLGACLDALWLLDPRCGAAVIGLRRVGPCPQSAFWPLLPSLLAVVLLLAAGAVDGPVAQPQFAANWAHGFVPLGSGAIDFIAIRR